MFGNIFKSAAKKVTKKEDAPPPIGEVLLEEMEKDQPNMQKALDLLAKGAPVDFRDDYQGTALIRAAEKGHTEFVRLLLDRGSDIDAIDEEHGYTAAIYALKNGHFDTFQLLKDRGANPGIAGNDGTTVFIHAVRQKRYDIADEILARGGVTEAEKNTAFLWAMNAADMETAKYAFDRGADINAREESRDGYTALIRAAANGNIEAVKFLLDRKVDINLHDNNGSTPLMWAAEKGHFDIFMMLVERGAEMFLRNNYKKSALDYARKENNSAILEFLCAEEEKLWKLVRKTQLDNFAEAQAVLQNDIVPMKKIVLKK